MRLNFVILHEEAEWSEAAITESLLSLGHKVAQHDIRRFDKRALSTADVILNRVYASVANRNSAMIGRTLELLDSVRCNDARIVHNAEISRFDYSKSRQYIAMKSAAVPSPRTLLANNIAELCSGVLTLGFPCVIKPDCGGRAFQLHLVRNEYDLTTFKYRSNLLNWPLVVQEYVSSSTSFDFRVGVVGRTIQFAYARSFVALNQSAEPWVGSASRGSKRLLDVEVPESVRAVAVRASAAINSDLNVVDVRLSTKSPMVIENNLTPTFSNSHTRVASTMTALIDYLYAEQG